MLELDSDSETWEDLSFKLDLEAGWMTIFESEDAPSIKDELLQVDSLIKQDLSHSHEFDFCDLPMPDTFPRDNFDSSEGVTSHVNPEMDGTDDDDHITGSPSPTRGDIEGSLDGTEPSVEEDELTKSHQIVDSIGSTSIVGKDPSLSYSRPSSPIHPRTDSPARHRRGSSVLQRSSSPAHLRTTSPAPYTPRERSPISSMAHTSEKPPLSPNRRFLSSSAPAQTSSPSMPLPGVSPSVHSPISQPPTSPATIQQQQQLQQLQLQKPPPPPTPHSGVQVFVISPIVPPPISSVQSSSSLSWSRSLPNTPYSSPFTSPFRNHHLEDSPPIHVGRKGMTGEFVPQVVRQPMSPQRSGIGRYSLGNCGKTTQRSKRTRAATTTKKQLISSPNNSPCPNCQTQTSTLWRNCEISGNSAYLCNACGLRFKKGKYCPLCFYVYYDADPNPRDWERCTKCHSWTHKTCLHKHGIIISQFSYLCCKCLKQNEDKDLVNT